MALEITGLLIEKGTTRIISDKFKKREFVLDITEESARGSFPNYAKLQITQDKCNLLDNFELNQLLKVSFNIRGNKWEKDGVINYFSNLDAWKIETVSDSGSNSLSQPSQQFEQNYNKVSSNISNEPSVNSSEGDDLPF